MFQFRRFPTYTYVFSIRCMDIVHAGCPIRKSPDISLVYSSPRLIAVSHVLLRLPVPRHSPCALLSLTFRRLSTFMWSSLFSTKMNSSIFNNYPILNMYDLSRRLSYMPISRLSFLCSVFKVRSRVKPEFQHLNFKCWNSCLTFNNEYWIINVFSSKTYL